MEIVLSILSIVITLFIAVINRRFSRKSTERIITEIQKWHNSSRQLRDDIQSGRRNNYVEKTYPDISAEKQKKTIILSAAVTNKLKKVPKEVQKEIEKALRLWIETDRVSTLHKVKRVFESKFYMYKIGKFCLIFEETADKIL